MTKYIKEIEAVEEIKRDLNIPDDEYLDNIKFWEIISEKYELTDELIEKYKDYLFWDKLVISQNLSDNIILKYINHSQKFFGWDDLAYYQILSEDLIIKYFDKFSLRYLITRQKIPNKLINTRFINDVKNCLLLSEFVLNQVLSEEFIEEYFDIIPRDSVLLMQRITPYIRKKFNIDEDNKKDLLLLNQNLLYKTDIGKDWFISLIDKPLKYNPRTYLGNIVGDSENRSGKARIYYRDLNTTVTLSINKLEILRWNNNNFYKRAINNERV